MDSSATTSPIRSKKRRSKPGKRAMKDRSRSFVAEMFHGQSASIKKWSHHDRALLQKLGITPSTNNNNNGSGERPKLKVSPSLHPDLRQHAFEEEINSLSIELEQSKKNLLRT